MMFTHYILIAIKVLNVCSCNYAQDCCGIMNMFFVSHTTFLVPENYTVFLTILCSFGPNKEGGKKRERGRKSAARCWLFRGLGLGAFSETCEARGQEKRLAVVCDSLQLSGALSSFPFAPSLASPVPLSRPFRLSCSVLSVGGV